MDLFSRFDDFTYFREINLRQKSKNTSCENLSDLSKNPNWRATKDKFLQKNSRLLWFKTGSQLIPFLIFSPDFENEICCEILILNTQKKEDDGMASQ